MMRNENDREQAGVPPLIEEHRCADSKKVRIAVVQLQSHPALAVGHSDWLGEPFFGGIRCVELLAENKFSEAEDLKKICRDRYLRWAETRLRGVLRWFEERFKIDTSVKEDAIPSAAADEHSQLLVPVPTSNTKGNVRSAGEWLDMPDILVFPEGGIPREHLHLLVAFAAKTGTVIFAGTHSFEVSEEAAVEYNRLGVVLHDDNGHPTKFVDSAIKKSDLIGKIHPSTHAEVKRILGKPIASLSVLPIITPNESSTTEGGDGDPFRRNAFSAEFSTDGHQSCLIGKYLDPETAENIRKKDSHTRHCMVRLRAKTTLSPFEVTEGGGSHATEPPQVITVTLPPRTIRGGMSAKLRVLPVICAEAIGKLITPLSQEPYELLVIPSLNRGFEHFAPVIDYHAQRQIPVAYCNDGLFGDSTISFRRDSRNSAVFYSNPYDGRLPKESDGILVADVTPGYGGAQLGVSNPRQFYKLVALSAIVHDNLQNPAAHVARVLDAARHLMTPSRKSVSETTEWLADPLRVQILSAIIHDNPRAPIEHLESVLDAMRRLMMPSRNSSAEEPAEWLADPFRLVALVRTRLKEVENENVPTKIQKINLSHLISLTAKPSNAYPYEWRNHAHDCVVTKLDRPPELPQFSDEYLYSPLRDLDGDLAALCHIRTGRWFGRELLSDDDGDESRAMVLTRVRSECQKRMGSESGRVLAHLERIKDDARLKAKERLHNLVGSLVERFGATSGWLLPVDDPSRAEAAFHSDPALFITYNTTARYRIHLRPGADKRGIVKRVLRTRRAYLVNSVIDDADRVIDPYYSEFMFTTRSELAVPVFSCGLTNPEAEGDPGRRPPRLLAILNLESTRTGAFHPVAAGELQAAVSELVPDLNVFFAASGMDTLTAWHPSIHQWGSTNLLDQLCYAVVTPAVRTGEPSLTCTMWNHDRAKNRFQARSTVGFDYEYLASNSLDKTSFVGHVIESTNTSAVNVDFLKEFGLTPDAPAAWHLERLLRKGPCVHRVDLASSLIYPRGQKGERAHSEWQNIARKRKVRQMGIAEMIVAPLLGRTAPHFEPAPEEGEGGKTRSQTVLHRDAPLIRATGTINLYVYAHNPTRVGSGKMLLSHDETVFRIAELANRTVVDFYRLQRQVVASTLVSQLVESLCPGVAPFELLR
ncbi:MAG TPA: GAF domain-containing protein, partial [Chthoniobacteraceae bacterium]|nr:GAF domain-containing protein [Chthoniobacteraceae bacterium]